jgi:hypothetical protein
MRGWLTFARRRLGDCVKWPLYFAEGYGHFPLEEIKAWVMEAKAAGISYFFFDHLHYMLEDPEDHKAASKLIKEIKTLAKEQKVCINIIIQPNKLMDGQRLSLNSIKGGAAMGQAIDNLIILERVKNSETKNVVKLTLEAVPARNLRSREHLSAVRLRHDGFHRGGGGASRAGPGSASGQALVGRAAYCYLA